MVVYEWIPLLHLQLNSVLVSLLYLLRHSNALLFAGLTFFSLHQVFVGDVEERMYVLDGGGDWIEGTTLGFGWRFEESDLIGLE